MFLVNYSAEKALIIAAAFSSFWKNKLLKRILSFNVGIMRQQFSNSCFALPVPLSLLLSPSLSLIRFIIYRGCLEVLHFWQITFHKIYSSVYRHFFIQNIKINYEHLIWRICRPNFFLSWFIQYPEWRTFFTCTCQKFTSNIYQHYN